MSIEATETGFRITGHHVFWGLVAFFGLIGALDFWFASLAYKTFSGEAAHNPYETGLLYNRTLDQRRRSAALGWTSKLSVQPDGQVVVTLTNASQQPVNDLSGTITLARPATEMQNRTAKLVANAPGRYVASFGPLTGAWDAQISLSATGQPPFEASRRVILK